MSAPKWHQCLVCCKTYETRAEADACTHEAAEPDEAAVFLVSPVWWFARLLKRGVADAVAEGTRRAREAP